MKNITKNILAFAVITVVAGGGIASSYAGNIYAKALKTDVDIVETNDETDVNSQTYGDSSVKPDERIYGIGSVSKIYVTAAVMQLVEQGLVELDEPVKTYIPGFTMADARYTDITVRMLMNHTSGIMGTSAKNMFLYDDNYRDEEYVVKGLSSQHLIHEPGEYAAYCNDGFGLLEVIVENVTGMDYTEYVAKNIAAPVGATHTGSPFTLFKNEMNAPIIFTGNVPYDYDYCMSIGSGGIYATASDVAKFGSAFFTGNNVLLSQDSLSAMATRWNDKEKNTDIYKDASGLGWDYVESLAYEQADVTVLGKGGDISNQHAHLLVAPDEKVSIAVLSSGGSSSSNQLMAEALLDVVLNEKGIHINHEMNQVYDFTDEVPTEYFAYEGFYVFSSFSGPTFAYISFDDGMMHVKHFDFGRNETEDYRFTSDGSFVCVDEDGVPLIDCSIGRFAVNENGVYITAEMSMQVEGLGTNTYHQYVAERIDSNNVSSEAAASWQEFCGRDIVICNERYSSTDYDNPFAGAYMMDELPGYMYVRTGLGGRPLQIKDETNAVSFTTMPCSSNRDLIDVQIITNTLSDGAVVTELMATTGLNYRFVDELPVFNSNVTEVSLWSDEVQWFKIGDDVAGTTITADYPKNAVIYVYNKYHEVVYSTHMINADGNIPLPYEGYIMFAGEDSGEICIK